MVYVSQNSIGHRLKLIKILAQYFDEINPLTPNVNYTGRTAPLTSKVTFYIFIQQI